MRIPANAGDGYAKACHAGAGLANLECFQINPLPMLDDASAGSVEGDAQRGHPAVTRSRRTYRRGFGKEAALGEIADPGSLPLLRRYKDDPDPDVRKTIRWAVRRFR